MASASGAPSRNTSAVDATTPRPPARSMGMPPRRRSTGPSGPRNDSRLPTQRSLIPKCAAQSNITAVSQFELWGEATST